MKPGSEEIQSAWAALDDGWRVCRRQIDAIVSESEFADGAFLTGFKIAYYHAQPRDQAAFNEIYQKCVEELSKIYHEVSSLGQALVQSHLLSNHSDPETWRAYPQHATRLALALRNLLERIQASGDKIRPHVPREYLAEMDTPFTRFSELTNSLVEVLEKAASYPPKIEALKNPVTPGYKQTEVGLIPDEWECSKIRDAAARCPNSIVGGPFGSDLVSADYVETGVPVIRGQNMAGAELSGEFAFVTKKKAQTLGANLARPEDLVFTQRGTLGQVTIVPREPFEIYLISQSQMKVSLDRSKHDPSFLHQYFTSASGQKQIVTSAIQTGVPHTNLGILRAYHFPAPPLSEQRAIAAALSDVDALLAALDRLIAKKRDLKQAAMQQLLTGQTRLPGFSGDWVVKRLGELGKCYRGVSYNPERDLSPDDRDTTIRLLRSNNVQNARIELNDLQFVDATRVSNLQRLQPNDVLICMANGSRDLVGKAGRFEVADDFSYTFGAFMGCFRPDGTAVDPALAFYQFQTERYRTHISILLAGSSINNLNPSSVEELEVEIPSDPTEQTAIASVLSDMDAELAALEQRREKTRALKQGMMQELLTGRTRLI